MTYDEVMKFIEKLDANTLKTRLLEFLTTDNEHGTVCVDDFKTDFIEFMKDDIKQIIVTNIKWDAPKSADLPDEVFIDINEENEYLLEDIHDYADVLCDYLSDIYEYCIETFEVTLKPNKVEKNQEKVDVSLEEKTEVAKRVYNSTEEITKSFIEDGWTNNTSFSELTLEEAREKGYLWAVEGINKGRKYFKMNVCGNIFDDRGKLVFLNLNNQEKSDVSLEEKIAVAQGQQKEATSKQDRIHASKTRN